LFGGISIGFLAQTEGCGELAPASGQLADSVGTACRPLWLGFFYRIEKYRFSRSFAMFVKYEKIDKNKIKTRSKPQARQEFDQSKLLALADSLLTGQLQPIGVLADYTLIWGERRLRAALLKKEITHLWAAVFDQEVTESEFLLMRATENFQRADLTDNEKWLTCKELRDANPQWQLQDLAANLHVSPGTITKLLSPSKCSPGWQEALAAGRVGISDCYAASGLPEADQAALLALKLSGASRDEIVHAGRKSRSGDTPAVKVTRVKLLLPSGVCIVASGAGLSLDDLIVSLSQAGIEAKKARSQDQDIKSFQAVIIARNKKRGA
jgi:ParB family transcriptional regulator, chromosome partitioning protein